MRWWLTSPRVSRSMPSSSRRTRLRTFCRRLCACSAARKASTRIRPCNMQRAAMQHATCRHATHDTKRLHTHRATAFGRMPEEHARTCAHTHGRSLQAHDGICVSLATWAWQASRDLHARTPDARDALRGPRPHELARGKLHTVLEGTDPCLCARSCVRGHARLRCGGEGGMCVCVRVRVRVRVLRGFWRAPLMEAA